MSDDRTGGPSEARKSVELNFGSLGRLRGSGLRFQPVLMLGQGGMAEVLLAVARGPSGFNKLVVLKAMRQELAEDEQLRRMFLAEAQLSARLNHPNVVQVHEIVEATVPCIVMEYLEGQPMSALHDKAGDNFDLPLQLQVLSEALQGLHYSHELKDYDGTSLNIVHRDVSPQNVFVTYGGVVKVLDFGIAKASNAAEHTQTGMVKGKLDYMPPEQLCGESVDRRADVFAIGCMLWSAAAGAKLWSGMPENEIMRALLAGSIPKPSEVRPVDPALEAIVMKALAVAPEDRYSTALELRCAIDQYLTDSFSPTSHDKLGNLVSEVFQEQREQRRQLVHLAITQPFSAPPTQLTPGIKAIVAGSGTTDRRILRTPKQRALFTAGIMLGTVVLAIGGLTALLAWHGDLSRVPTAQAAAPLPSKPTRIQVRLGATPSGAKFSLDGNPLPGNPAVLEVLPDAREHEVRVSLASYESQSRRIRFENDIGLEITLQPLARSSADSSTSPEPRAKATTRAKRVGKGGTSSAQTATSGGGACDPPFVYQNDIKVFKPECI